MPTNKDLKRLVRGRMRKTGESYTAARSQLLKKPKAPSPAEYAKLAGMSDEAVKAKTGCTWDKWVHALDRVKAETWSHKEIAEYVYEKYDVSGWWAQTVTVGYERIKGLREIGQRRGGGYEASKSKTFAVPVARLYRSFRDKRTRAKWLVADLTVRTATKDKSMRITWEDGSAVDVYFTSKGAAKSQVAIQHRRLPTKGAAANAKAYWEARLADLLALLQPKAAARP